ncbi:MAG: type II toxin-antitoxin system mRNA interferase toxin, RelE/StbE family [Magnetococcales bacterium]|nr:type II toxin-antitoxin system mRNA interferase toxin, RelE/StbE family [Magnetococcales bacterium]
MALFLADPKNPALKNHRLKGELKDLWSFSINQNYRIIYEYQDDGSIKLCRIGPHKEVY